MRISDWSSDVCSSDLAASHQHALESRPERFAFADQFAPCRGQGHCPPLPSEKHGSQMIFQFPHARGNGRLRRVQSFRRSGKGAQPRDPEQRFKMVESSPRSEEHTSELQSLMRISYAVFCLKKKNTT